MTQPTPPAPTPSAAPPAPTNTAPPASAPPAGQPQMQAQPTGGAPVQQPQQGGWPPQGYPQGPPVQYVPVMPIPPTLAQPTGGESGGDGGEVDLTKLPQWAQKQIQTLRDENAKRRVSERTAVVNQHAWMAAQQLGANAQAVIGSLAWQAAGEKLDPSSPDFGRHLAEAIYQTVQQNPWMAQQSAYPPAAPGVPGQPVAPAQQPPAPAGQPGQTGQAPPAVPYGQPGYPPPQPYPPYPGVPGGYPPPGYPAPQPPPGWLRPPTSGAEFATGHGGTTPITEDQLAQMTPDQIKTAYDEGRLKHLM